MSLPILNKFTTHFKKTLTDASELAVTLNHDKVEPDHLLYSLSKQRGSIGAEILHKAGMKTEAIDEYIKERQNFLTTPLRKGPPTLSDTTKKVITKAASIASSYNHQYVGTEHLLTSLLEIKDESIIKLLKKNLVNDGVIQNHLKIFMRSTSKFPDLTRVFEQGEDMMEEEGRQEEGIPQPPTRPALDFFATDLTNEDLQSKIDPVVGRRKEIDRLIHILARRTKNNPVLIGDAGVGKTAIVEGLAKKIAEGKVPSVLIDKKILKLDLTMLIAGTIYRGEFENRIRQIIEEIKADPNIIIFIDELHTIVGAGNASGQMDTANILKPALAKGEIRCIGATTLDEYKKSIEADPALERRFQKIIVEEPSEEETVAILRGLRTSYENYHQVRITNDAIQTAVELSRRYITDKFLPDKAIDLIDEAASEIKVAKQSHSVASHMKGLEKKLRETNMKKQQSVWQEKYDMALRYKEEEAELQKKIQRLKQEQSVSGRKTLGAITKENIIAVISRMTKIPLAELQASERDRLLHLEDELKKYIIGQEEAIQKVAKSIQRNRAGLSSPTRPIGSFIFLGPSGVGKTELAKQIARNVFEDEKALIRFDMSEFSESFQASKLIGSPAGYVGYKEGAKLTDQVKRRPYSVVLFDEIEKAHPDIFNLLLQILEDGHMTDATGKMVNFKNTIIVLTSNIGLHNLNQTARIGFDADTPEEKKKAAGNFEEIQEKVLSDLRGAFRPEFLNRIDQIIVFKPLTPEHLVKIAEKQLAELSERVKSQGIFIQFNKGIAKFIAEKSFRPDEGARAIRRNIENLVEGPLAEKILSGPAQENTKFKLRIQKDKILV